MVSACLFQHIFGSTLHDYNCKLTQRQPGQLNTALLI